VHGVQVGDRGSPHDKGERAVGFMVSTTTGKGGGKKAEGQDVLWLTRPGRGEQRTPHPCLIACVRVWC